MALDTPNARKLEKPQQTRRSFLDEIVRADDSPDSRSLAIVLGSLHAYRSEFDIVTPERGMPKFIVLFIVSGVLALAADVSGTWQLTVETNQGTGSPTVVLQQKGEQLTGTYTSPILGEAKVTGTVKGNVIQFGLEGDAGGQKIKVMYKGIVESATAMKGTAVLEGIDDKATWTATKK